MKKEYTIECRHCSRFIQVVENSGTIRVKCGNSACRKLRDGLDKYKVVFLTDYNKDHMKGKK